MGLGPIEITETLNHQIGQRVGFDGNAARLTQLAEQPPKGTNRLLISHTHGSLAPQERIMGSIQEAEIVVYEPDDKGASEPVARPCYRVGKSHQDRHTCKPLTAHPFIICAGATSPLLPSCPAPA